MPRNGNSASTSTSSGSIGSRWPPVAFQAWTEPVGKGLALQFLFIAMPTVDTRHLWETSEQHLWGRGELEPLSVTLNAGQSIVTGSHGLEMRGTPRSAGQRTLEGEDRSRRRQR